MSQLMKTLLYAMSPGTQSEAEAKALKAAKEAIRAVEQHLTYDEFENLWTAISDIQRGSEVDTFTLGFCLGFQLALEGTRPLEKSFARYEPLP